MDPLERELRDLLSSDRLDLPPTTVPLSGVYAGADRRRHRRTAVVSAAGALVLVVGALAAGLGGRLSAGPDPADDSAARASASATPEPSPDSAWAGADVLSVTATSTETFVALGATRGSCVTDCQRLAQSRDGGRTFTSLPMPDGLSAGEGPTDLRFGSADDGWLFGGDGRLWATHDGGYRWSEVSMPGAVVRLEAAAGTVSALVAGSSTEDDAVHLWRSPVAKDDWQEVPALAVLPPADLAVQGAGNVAVIGARGSGFWIARPRGLTEFDNPCDGALGVRLSWVGSLWATCVTGTAATIHVSTDGSRWTVVAPPAASGAWSNQILLGARTDRDAIVLPSHEEPMRRLSSAGYLTDVAGPPAPSSTPSYIGFTTPAVGYAIVAGALHRTDDGGDTWKRMSLENP